MLPPAALARFRANRPALVGLAMVLALVAFAVFGPWLVPAHPNVSDFSLRRGPFGAPPGPSPSHWLGTDPLFRDLLARLADGARLSLGIAAASTALALAVGTAAGVAAGYAWGTRAGALDTALMRVVDVALAFPFLLLVTAVGVAIDRADATTVTLILGLTAWCGVARVTRARTQQIKQADYVLAARGLGARPLRIVWRHVLPNIAGTLLVIGSHAMAQMILAEAVLGYLTVGIQPPQATWGRMLHEAEGYLGVRPSLVAAPGFAILLAVLGFTRVGDGLRDALDVRSATAAPTRVPLDLLIAALALLLVGLATPGPVAGPLGDPDPDHAATPQRGGRLRLATHTNLRTLDPALAYDEASGTLVRLLFATLLRWQGDGTLAPDLAETVSSSEGGTRITVRLRPGLLFHDGAALGARDVKRSLERTLHPDTPSPGASLYASLTGAGAYRAGKAGAIEGIEVVDDRTVAFRLDRPDATFMPVLAMGFAAPVCPSMGATVNARATVTACGAGPFRLTSSEHSERLRLNRFEGYHRAGRPYLDGIDWATNVPAHTQRYRFEAGELDLVRELTTADLVMYRADPRWRGRGRWSLDHATTGVFLNTELPPFHDRHLRRAVSFALDPSVLPLVRPNVAPADRMLPPSIPGPARDEPLRRFDRAAALREMRHAGYAFDPATGAGGYPHPIDYLTIPDTFAQSAAEVFQQQLAAVGLRVRLKLVSHASWLAEVSTRGAATMGYTGWHADFPDPSNFFEPTLTSRAIQDEGSQNHAFFSNAELDDVVARAQVEPDRDTRMRLYARAEAIVHEEAPWIPAYHGRLLELWHPYLRGYTPHPIVPLSLDDAWLHPDRAPRIDPMHIAVGRGPAGGGLP